MKSFILVALSFTLATAHVRMRYEGFSIRNAGTANSDGKFSTAGPCGGATVFGGSTGEIVTKVIEGAEMELNIAYNGGHKSDTKNFFSVAYMCGKPGKFTKVFAGDAVKDNPTLNTDFTDANGVLLKAVDIISPDVYPVDATDSLTSGYKIKFKVPKPMAGTDGDKCTISLVEYRNWGGCVDLVIEPRDPNAPTPPPPPPPSLFEITLAQTYDITDLDYKMKLQTADKCGGGDCDCKKALEDKTCLWQSNKGMATPGDCMQCKWKDKDGCLCDVTGDVSYIKHYGTCTHDSPNCLCMDGLIRIWHQTSATTGTAELNAQVINPDKPDQVWSMSAKVPLNEDGKSLATEPITVVLKSGEQTLEQQMIVKSTPAATGEVYVSLTIVDDKPQICSFEATIKQDEKEVDRQKGKDPSQDGSNDRVEDSSPAAIVTVGWIAFVVAGALRSLF